MGKGPVITALVALGSLGAVFAAFVSSASPYAESISEARKSANPRLHLAGDIVPNSVRTDLKSGKLSFLLRDIKGEQIEVIHRGDPPANMGAATKVVAIGKMSGQDFQSSDLLIKCPSKYEGASNPKATPTVG